MNPRVLDIAASLIREIAAKKQRDVDRSRLGRAVAVAESRSISKHAMRHVAEHGVKYTPNAGRSGAARSDRAPLRAIRRWIAMRERLRHGRLARGDVRRDQDAARSGARRAADRRAGVSVVCKDGGARGHRGSQRRDERCTTTSRSTPSASRQRSASERAPSCSVRPAIRRRASSRRTPPRSAGSRARAARRRTGLGDSRRDLPRADLRRRRGLFRKTLSAHDRDELAEQEQRAHRACGSAGFSGRRDFVEQAIKVHAWVTSCADTFAQHVALHVFHTPGALQEHAAWYREQPRRAARGAARVRAARSSRRMAPSTSACDCPDGLELARGRRRAHRTLRRRRDPRHRLRRLDGRLAAPELGRTTRSRARRHPAHRRILQLPPRVNLSSGVVRSLSPGNRNECVRRGEVLTGPCRDRSVSIVVDHVETLEHAGPDAAAVVGVREGSARLPRGSRHDIV